MSRWWRRRRPESPAAPVVVLCGVLGEPQAGRDAVRAVSAVLGSQSAELADVLEEAMRERPDAFVLSLCQLGAALALSTPDSASVAGSLTWWALRHEVVASRCQP